MEDYNQDVLKEYTVEFDDKGMLTSILVEEEGGFGRWLFKRHAKGMELPLTDDIFKETVEAYLDDGIFEAEAMYLNLRVNDEYYANLLKKVYKQYIKKYVLQTSLHQDAFWG